MPYTQIMSLAPLALSIALFVFWIGLGWSLIAIAEPGMEPLKALLVAPALGVALTVLPVFWLSAFGLPVSDFARPLALVLAAIAITIAGWRRPPWKSPELLPAVVVLLAVVLIGFPTLYFGFDWIANANDDWGVYNLRAIRYLHGGFYQQPSIEAMREGRNYPGVYWYADVVQTWRPGSDLVLAWVSTIVGKNPFFVFMPVILAFHGVLCFAAAALARSWFKSRTALLAGLVLTAVAPLSVYAVHQQLIAQVIGLAFTCALASLAFVSLHQLASARRIAVVSILSSGFLLLYTELVPLFGLGFVLFHASHALDKEWGWRRSWPVLSILPAVCIFLGAYTIDAAFYLLSQFQQSSAQGVFDGLSIFPYFRVPSGVAVLFGISRLAELPSEPWLSLSIAAGFLLLAVALAGTLIGLAARQGVAFVPAGLLLMILLLIVRGSDFGIFKIAMFVQAFVWFCIVAVLARLRLNWAAPVYLGILSTLILTDIRHLDSSLKHGPGAGSSMGNASQERLLSRFLDGGPDAPCDADFETPLPPVIKILSATPGCARSFIARPTFGWGITPDRNPFHDTIAIRGYVERAVGRVSPVPTKLPFDYPQLGSVAVVTRKPAVEYRKLVVDIASRSIFNRTDSSRNRLIFVNSNLSSHYYLPESGIAGIYATEADTFFPSGYFAAVGRYLLFRVSSPSKSVRLELDLTTSVLGDGKAQLPAATVVGEQPVQVGLSGHGAARVISPPLSPLVVDGVAYVLLDLGAEPKPIKIPRHGLMKMYGTEVPIDPRRMVGFARGISLIDADEEGAATPPSSISHFPADLAKEKLQFSGIYEDGWLGDEGFVELSNDCPGSKVVFRGMFPRGLGLDSIDLLLKVAGGESVVKHIEPGPFELELPANPGRSRIEFSFSALGRLPGGDNRPATVLLSSVSIEGGGSKAAEDLGSQPPQPACQ
ncbi:hypothetical protein JQ625_28450 [Bradyrhizobium diazoefficiens]|nr:hypothetical protein [Bradyrhizobium diazoefficiens]MBR0778775.1 hypothetical protein [Bradyrhizobium diazoefficiens]